jgi:hypothetical protein
MTRSVGRLTPLLIVGVTIVLSGCPNVEQVEADLQAAITQLDSQSASWQVTLQSLETKLVQDGDLTLSNQVTQLMENGIATVGTEIRCDANFIGSQMEIGLLQMLSSIDPSVKAPAFVPAICQVVPSTVDMNDPPDVINFYGYNFNVAGANMNLAFEHDGTVADVTSYLTLVTPYLATANISQTNGIPLCGEQNRTLLFQSGSTELSTVSFVAKTCPQGAYQAGPPAQPLPGYPHEYSIGPNLFGATSNFVAGSPCMGGFARVDPPQFSNLGGNGDCTASWASSSNTDCSVNIHMGVSSEQSTQCLLSITEVGQPVWVPPAPCGCQ